MGALLRAAGPAHNAAFSFAAPRQWAAVHCTYLMWDRMKSCWNDGLDIFQLSGLPTQGRKKSRGTRCRAGHEREREGCGGCWVVAAGKGDAGGRLQRAFAAATPRGSGRQGGGWTHQT